LGQEKLSKKLNASENGEIRFNKQQNGKSNELFQILKIASKMADADYMYVVMQKEDRRHKKNTR